MDIYSKIPVFTGSKIKYSILIGLTGLFSLAFFCFFPLKISESNTTLIKEITIEKENFSENSLIILSGNTLMPDYNLPNPESQITRKIPVIVTAYSSTPWETWGNPFVTAAGTWVKDGIVANNYLPFGTKVRMPEIYGDRVFIVEDRMHSRKGNYHFDIWFPSHSEAVNFGVKRTYVEVLEN